MTEWLEQWRRYAEEQQKRFAGAGCAWPGDPLVNGELREIVCLAIIEQSKVRKK
jgi:hypothetical protein